MKGLEFWDDTPILTVEDEFFLPVDEVIKEIFRRIKACPANFKGINKYLKKQFCPAEIEVWDDLWFWGFITQKGTGDKRTLGFNTGKYWLQLHTPKTKTAIKEIETKCQIFIEIIQK